MEAAPSGYDIAVTQQVPRTLQLEIPEGFSHEKYSRLLQTIGELGLHARPVEADGMWPVAPESLPPISAETEPYGCLVGYQEVLEFSKPYMRSKDTIATWEYLRQAALRIIAAKTLPLPTSPNEQRRIFLLEKQSFTREGVQYLRSLPLRFNTADTEILLDVDSLYATLKIIQDEAGGTRKNSLTIRGIGPLRIKFLVNFVNDKLPHLEPLVPS